LISFLSRLSCDLALLGGANPVAVWAILAISTSLQVVATVQSVRLIGTSERMAAWIVLSSVMAVQTVRRIVTLVLVVSGRSGSDPLDDALGLLISMGMLATVWLIRDHFEAMARSEERFRTVADFTYDWEVWQDPKGVYRYCSPSCERLTGYPRRAFEADPRLLDRLVHPDDRVGWETHLAEAHAELERPGTRSEPALEIDFRIIRSDGQIRWIHHVCHAIRDAQGRMLGRRSSNRDITERKEAEWALRESQRQLVITQEISRTGSWRYDFGTCRVSGSAEACRIFGFPAVDGDFPLGDVEAFIPDRERVHGALEALVRDGRDYNLEYTIHPADGSPPREVHSVAQLERDGQGNPLRVRGFLRDITEQKRAEAEKGALETLNHQLQKGESLGLMASSIAHHFNNKLQSVMGNLELLAGLSRDPFVAPFLAGAKEATEKAAEMSQRMLVYLGQASGAREPQHLAEICGESLPLLQRDLPPTVTLETVWPATGPVIRGNAEEIRQILSSLVTNAWEAMDEAPGHIRLRVDTRPADRIPAAHRFPIGWQPREQSYACLEVSDTGGGIAEADIEKLFDPFFSTKFIGRGLGLATVLGLAQAHGAGITVESRPGRGSTFGIHFPLAAPSPPQAAGTGSGAPRPETGGTILLVDDDDMLLLSTGALLEMMGFGLLTARDGAEAVEVFRRHRDEIRCVITDLTMPRMTGWETLTALRQLDPTLPVVLMSGYNRAQVMSRARAERPQAFLGKPFSLEQLGEALDQALRADR
jgi:two-component system, cell cycle sensor histidine kinase and response regulator CckA